MYVAALSSACHGLHRQERSSICAFVVFLVARQCALRRESTMRRPGSMLARGRLGFVLSRLWLWQVSAVDCRWCSGSSRSVCRAIAAAASMELDRAAGGSFPSPIENQGLRHVVDANWHLRAQAWAVHLCLAIESQVIEVTFPEAVLATRCEQRQDEIVGREQ
jgi:hypothetical protein